MDLGRSRALDVERDRGTGGLDELTVAALGRAAGHRSFERWPGVRGSREVDWGAEAGTEGFKVVLIGLTTAVAGVFFERVSVSERKPESRRS